MATIPYAHITQGPAFVRPIATPVVVPRRRGINPIIPILCLGLILFLIAATIVIALIPVYLRDRGSRLNLQASQYYVLYRINNGTLPIGILTDNNCAVIQQDQQNLIAGNNGVSPSSVFLTSCMDTGNTSLTSRRRRQSQQAEGNLISLVGFLIGAGNCLRGSCLAQRAANFRNLLFNRGTFYLTLAGANGTQYLFSLNVIDFAVAPAQEISSSTGVSTGGTTGGSTGSTTGGSTGISTNSTTAVQIAARANDIAILNYALILEHLESYFYSVFQNQFTRNDFIAAGFPNETYDYFYLISSHEHTHVAILTSIIEQLGGTPVPNCTYNFSSVIDVPSYVAVARVLENTGAMAYTGAVNGIADTILREIAATVASVEARHAAYLNILNGTVPFPDTFQPAALPADIVVAISPFISCPFQITSPVIPYIGSITYPGTPPTSNDTSVAPYTQAMYTNDLRALNFALVAEQLESTFYNTFVSNFTFGSFASSLLSADMIASYFSLIRSYEAAHAAFLRQTIIGRGGSPVPLCAYTFNITDVSDFVQMSRLLENTGAEAYDSAINTISDPNLIRGAATIGLVEARFASFLNLITGNIPFPDAVNPTTTLAQIVAILSPFQQCPFTPALPVVLNPSTLSLTIPSS